MTRGRLKLCSTPPIHLLFKACLNYVLCLPYFIYASIQCQDFVGNLSRITISIFPTSRTFAGDSCLVVCPHCVLRQKTNLPVIRRHQSRNQGLGTPWSIGHAQNIRSLGRSWVKQNRTYFQCKCIWVQ